MTSAPPARSRAPVFVSWASSVLLALGYGVCAGLFGWFPSGVFRTAAEGYRALGTVGDPAWYYKQLQPPYPPPIGNSGRATPGVNLVTGIGSEHLFARLLDLDGRILHEWRLDWFELWPDATHVPDRLRPRERPGTHIHGALVLDDGDLVFHFEHLGMLRIDREHRVVWRLPYQTHHSIHRDDDGNLWVCGQKERLEPLPYAPNLSPPFVEDFVVVVSPDGKVLREWSVPELLMRNGYQGLLAMPSQHNFQLAATGDVTHMNHVETFPRRLPGGFFTAGDVLVSLRNVHTVFVFDQRNGTIKFASTGQFVRQHDPHFVDGNTISVFDNHFVAGPGAAPQSRIALLSAPDHTVRTWFAGSPKQPFHTPILGRHQWLPNNHLLITDSCAGRAFELDAQGQVVWWYVHYVQEGVVGAIEQVDRIPAALAERRSRN